MNRLFRVLIRKPHFSSVVYLSPQIHALLSSLHAGLWMVTGFIGIHKLELAGLTRVSDKHKRLRGQNILPSMVIIFVGVQRLHVSVSQLEIIDIGVGDDTFRRDRFWEW